MARKITHIDRESKILSEIPADLRAQAEEVKVLLGKAEERVILARFRLGQLVDLAMDVAKYGTRAPVLLGQYFRLGNESLRRARELARGWGVRELESAVADDPLLKMGHAIVLADVTGPDRVKWLRRVKHQAMSVQDLIRAFRGSTKPKLGSSRTPNPARLADGVLGLAKTLERADLSKLSYEALTEVSKSISEAALKLMAIDRQVGDRLLRRAG